MIQTLFIRFPIVLLGLRGASLQFVPVDLDHRGHVLDPVGHLVDEVVDQRLVLHLLRRHGLVAQPAHPRVDFEQDFRQFDALLTLNEHAVHLVALADQLGDEVVLGVLEPLEELDEAVVDVVVADFEGVEDHLGLLRAEEKGLVELDDADVLALGHDLDRQVAL